MDTFPLSGALRDRLEKHGYVEVTEGCTALFIRANAGGEIEAEIPSLLGLMTAPGGSLHAVPPLTLYAAQSEARRQRLLESVRAHGIADRQLLWCLREDSVRLPAISFEWEADMVSSADQRRAPTPGTPKTFSVTVTNATLEWKERNLLSPQFIADFLQGGPPERRPVPTDVLAKLRAVVGGPAGGNRVAARDRLLRRLRASPESAGCEACSELQKGACADLREHEGLPRAAATLMVVAVRRFPAEELRFCPACGATYHFENDYEFQYTDMDSIVPMAREAAIEFAQDAAVVA